LAHFREYTNTNMGDTKMQARKSPWLLTACLIFSGCTCPGGLLCPAIPPDGSHGTVVGPSGQTVTTDCGNMIDYQSHTAALTGLKVTIPVSSAGSPAVDLGGANLNRSASRQASDLIEALDNAQLMYCKGLLLVAPEDRYKVLQDYSTLTVTLSTLLRNLSIAATPDEAKAAVATAATAATTTTDAARQPPSPASAATVAAVAPAAAATPDAAQTAVTNISQAAAQVANAATAVTSTLGPASAVTPARPKM
jgi:hypothetical protein